MMKFKSFLKGLVLFLGVLQSTLLLPDFVVAQEVGQTNSTALLENEIFNRVNQFRAKNRLNRLIRSDLADQLAREHSLDMASRGDIDHADFNERVQIIEAAFPNANSFAENVAFNRGVRNPARKAVKGWKNSSGHRRNILGNYTHTGIGVANNGSAYYFTQIFFRVSGLTGPSPSLDRSKIQFDIEIDCLTEEELKCCLSEEELNELKREMLFNHF